MQYSNDNIYTQSNNQEATLSGLSPKYTRELYDDDDFIPSKQREVNSTNYSNTYLKRLYFRKELTDFIIANCRLTDCEKVDGILKNVYYEEQLEKSNADILSESIKIETDRVCGTSINIIGLKNIVSKYF